MRLLLLLLLTAVTGSHRPAADADTPSSSPSRRDPSSPPSPARDLLAPAAPSQPWYQQPRARLEPGELENESLSGDAVPETRSDLRHRLRAILRRDEESLRDMSARLVALLPEDPVRRPVLRPVPALGQGLRRLGEGGQGDAARRARLRAILAALRGLGTPTTPPCPALPEGDAPREESLDALQSLVEKLREKQVSVQDILAAVTESLNKRTADTVWGSNHTPPQRHLETPILSPPVMKPSRFTIRSHHDSLQAPPPQFPAIPDRTPELTRTLTKDSGEPSLSPAPSPEDSGPDPSEETDGMVPKPSLQYAVGDGFLYMPPVKEASEKPTNGAFLPDKLQQLLKTNSAGSPVFLPDIQPQGFDAPMNAFKPVPNLGPETFKPRPKSSTFDAKNFEHRPKSSPFGAENFEHPLDIPEEIEEAKHPFNSDFDGVGKDEPANPFDGDFAGFGIPNFEPFSMQNRETMTGYLRNDDVAFGGLGGPESAGQNQQDRENPSIHNSRTEHTEDTEDSLSFLHTSLHSPHQQLPFESPFEQENAPDTFHHPSNGQRPPLKNEQPFGNVLEDSGIVFPPRGVRVVLKDGDAETWGLEVTLQPGMSVHKALYEAEVTSQVSRGTPELRVDLAESPECYVIAEVNGRQSNNDAEWNIKVTDAHQQTVYNSACLPSSRHLTLHPGYSISLSYVSRN